MPAEIGEVTSSTLRPCLPAALSSDFACVDVLLALEARAGRRVEAAVVVGGRHALAEERRLHRLLAIHQRRIAWRTRTSLNGAVSTRIVIGFQRGGRRDDRLQVAVRLEHRAPARTAPG